MKILPRVQLGQPILRKKARALKSDEIHSVEVQALIKSMFYTLRQTGGIGLAAPQVGESIQLCIINVGPNNKHHPDSVGAPNKRERFVMINPKIVEYSKDKRTIYEGCLSFINLFGEVERPRSVKVEYMDQYAKLQQKELKGLVATVFQHEADHLKGIVWVDRATDTKTFMTRSEYKKMKLLEKNKV